MSPHADYLPMQPVSTLEDQQVVDLLEGLRARAAEQDGEPGDIAAGIAELEAEAARRNLALPSVREPVPAAVALQRFRDAMHRGDIEAAGAAILHMDAAGLWYASFRVRGLADVQVRIYLLGRVIFCIEWGVLGEARARNRRARLTAASHLSDAEFAAYLVQCLDALLTVSIVNMGQEEPVTSKYGHVNDAQVVSLLGLVRSFDFSSDENFGGLASEVVELELEAARRGLQLDSRREPIPAALAAVRCRTYIDRGDIDNAARCMWDMDAAGMWLTFRHVRSLMVTAARLFLCERLLYVIDTRCLGTDAAVQRSRQLAGSGLEDRELDAYLEQSITAHFTIMMASGPDPF